MLTRKQVYNLIASAIYNSIENCREGNPNLAITNTEIVGVLDVLTAHYRENTSIDMVNRMVFREMNKGDEPA
jgi:hypothetical protein